MYQDKLSAALAELEHYRSEADNLSAKNKEYMMENQLLEEEMCNKLGEAEKLTKEQEEALKQLDEEKSALKVSLLQRLKDEWCVYISDIYLI